MKRSVWNALAAAALVVAAIAFGTAYRSAQAAPSARPAATLIRAQGLGDNEVCQPDTFLGRIDVGGGGHTVGEIITEGNFSIKVTIVGNSGEILGFEVVGGAYDRIVIHAGEGSDTFFDPTGPFDHALSFVAFCGAEQAATDTPVPPTDTPTNTAVPPTDTPTETSVPPTDTPTNTATATEIPTETGAETEVPGATDTPTATLESTETAEATETATLPVEGAEETPVPTVAVLPSTGTETSGGGSGMNALALLIGILAAATAAVAFRQRPAR